MNRDSQRILTTHAGSLPRPPELVPLVLAREAGEPVDATQLGAEMRVATEQLVRKQVEVGMDVLNDGEISRPSYGVYVGERLNGFGGETTPGEFGGQTVDKIFGEFPDFVELMGHLFAPEAMPTFPACDGPISHRDLGPVQQDIDNLKSALNGAEAERAFMATRPPGVIAMVCANRYYSSEEDYLEAIATAMREEYEAIHRAGFVLQLDCPDLTRPAAGTSLEEWRTIVRQRVQALNHGVENIPAADMRLHLCWGGFEMPRNHDVPLRDIIDIVLEAKPAGLMTMGANGRHAHEWKVFEDVKLPAGKYLVPGVIDSTTNVIEHPEAVAERLVRYASVVGGENVMAAPDCGFSSPNTAAKQRVAPSIVWAKLKVMSEGAELATKELWLDARTKPGRGSVGASSS